MDLEDQVSDLEILNDQLDAATSRAQNKYRGLKMDFKEKIKEENGLLVAKMLVWDDLIREQDRILKIYCSNSSVRLTTNKLDELRKKGGYV